MKTLLLLLVFKGVFTFAAEVKPAASPVLEFKVDICKDTHQITQEMIELELSGYRWQGGDSPCLKQSKFKTMYAFKHKVGDSYLLDPEFILPDARDVRIVSEKLGLNEVMDVKIAYIAKKNGKDVPVEDEFSYILNFGKNRVARGCASIFSDPEHFVMRESCVKD